MLVCVVREKKTHFYIYRLRYTHTRETIQMAMKSIPRGGRERTKVASLAATGPHEEQLEVGAGKPRENKTRVHV